MQSNSVKLYSLPLSDVRTYIFTAAFVVGNILLPQLCHLIPRGGLILLPIYFFTLIGAYKYGWRVGLMTAVLSPVINHLMFGMPSAGVLPLILAKSVVLALTAGYAAHRFKSSALWVFVAIVATYQVVGTLAEWAMVGDFWIAVQDFRIGIPGMLIQIFGGYLFVRYMARLARD